MKIPGIIILSIISVSLFSCKTKEIVLHGDITGIVTDASTGEPVEAALIKIDQSIDSTTTGSDGTYLLTNLNPGQYEIQASKSTYALYNKSVTVASAETQEIDFPLFGIPEPDPSTSFLDFSVDSTTISFSISNSGKGKFTYVLTPSQPWITLSPAYGDITNDTDKIIITINKTGLSEGIYKESIRITSFTGQIQLTDIIIPVYLNGVMDGDGNYYKVVRIGTQIFIAENLKTTRYNDGTAIPYINNEPDWITLTTPGYCWYNDAPSNKDTYGEMYNWYAVNTGNLCPTGWHVPTFVEWNYLGGPNSGNKLKEIGTIHWLAPSAGTNESGFTALPGGYRNGGFYDIGASGAWWSSTEYSTHEGADWGLTYNSDDASFGHDTKQTGLSVRCMKD